MLASISRARLYSSSTAAAGGASTPNYSEFFSSLSSRRKPSAIRALMPLTLTPGMISLGGGLPNPTTFPFKSIDVTLADNTKLNLSGKELAASLQYSATQGMPDFLNRLRSFQQHYHSPPNSVAWDVHVTAGSQEGLTKAFSMLLDQEDSLLIESPSYTGALSYVEPIKCNLASVATDMDGIIPSKLADVLQSWDRKNPGKRRPKALYTIPTGQNPSGSTMSFERKKAIYALACQYNFIILEDDPYYFLQYPWTSPLQPSFLSMDVQGRVLRFDSMSKVLSSGIRVGWVTGATPLIKQIELDVQSSSLHASGVSQALLNLVMGHLGLAGWDTHVANIRKLYEGRRDMLAAIAHKHMSQYATWNTPQAGMFFWMKLNGVPDTKSLINQEAVKAKVLYVPGSAFEPASAGPSPYVRAAYSTASEAEMNTAMERLAGLMKARQAV